MWQLEDVWVQPAAVRKGSAFRCLLSTRGAIRVAGMVPVSIAAETFLRMHEQTLVLPWTRASFPPCLHAHRPPVPRHCSRRADRIPPYRFSHTSHCLRPRIRGPCEGHRGAVVPSDHSASTKLQGGSPDPEIPPRRHRVHESANIGRKRQWRCRWKRRRQGR